MTTVGENRPLLKTASSPSREFRLGPGLGTCSVCRCLSCDDPAWWGEWVEGDAADGEVYIGGDENRWGDAVGARGVGVSEVGVGVAGNNADV